MHDRISLMTWNSARKAINQKFSVRRLSLKPFFYLNVWSFFKFERGWSENILVGQQSTFELLSL